jgi:hypothetical protein
MRRSFWCCWCVECDGSSDGEESVSINTSGTSQSVYDSMDSLPESKATDAQQKKEMEAFDQYIHQELINFLESDDLRVSFIRSHFMAVEYVSQMSLNEQGTHYELRLKYLGFYKDLFNTCMWSFAAGLDDILQSSTPRKFGQGVEYSCNVLSVGKQAASVLLRMNREPQMQQIRGFSAI